FCVYLAIIYQPMREIFIEGKTATYERRQLTIGAQEINHAELRGILRAITHTGAAHNLTIYSDSFNSVLFCTKGRKTLQITKEWQYKDRNKTSN
ncbi:hypothetical protein PROFUN_16830, partial [Planoprotostelium fungivorum]